VDAIVKFTKEGDKIPLEIVWDDGRRFEVDRVLDVTKAASLKREEEAQGTNAE